MAAKAANRCMPSSERSYTLFLSPDEFSSEPAWLFRAPVSRCFCFPIEQEEIDV
jgi:hypothetical protein